MVVPTYNDLESLKELIALIDAQKSETVRYLIVDNGSNNQQVTNVLALSSPFWNSIQLNENAGFGGGISAGIKYAETDFVGWMPGNLKILPKNVEEMVKNISFTPNIFVKCRRIRSSKLARTKTFLAGLVQSIISGQYLFDTGGTPTICKRDFFLGITDLPTDYIIESRILFEAKSQGLGILRPKIEYGERRFGESHWQRGLRTELRLMKAISKDSIYIRRKRKFEKN
jgi:glycosyltransferase involved in cell wall biosynthesis